MNLQYIYGTLSNRECENPLDFERMAANPMEWYMIATDATTGKPKYFTRGDMRQDDYRVLMASCCIRWRASLLRLAVCLTMTVRWVIRSLCKRLLRTAATKVVLILTKPMGTIRADGTDRKLARVIHRKYPHAAEQLACGRSIITKVLRWPKSWPPRAKVLIIAPDDTCGVKTLTRDQEALKNCTAKA